MATVMAHKAGGCKSYNRQTADQIGLSGHPYSVQARAVLTPAPELPGRRVPDVYRGIAGPLPSECRPSGPGAIY